jgi:hypothetical protein
MKHEILILCVTALIASGCVISDMASRSTQDYTSSATVDEPYAVLNAYGNWIDVPMFGRVWQPAVQADWRPYMYGQWVWTDQGWMWESDEPFGWVVYHYGYWTQIESLGWVWIPGNEWSPARVDWYTGDDYIGWAPMAPPHAHYPGAYQTGYENYWTVVPTSQFTRLNVGAYRTLPPAPRTPHSNVRGRATDRPPDIITIQGATHQLISPRRTEQDQVRIGRRTVTRVRIPQEERPALPSPVYVSPATPDVSQPPTPATPPPTSPGRERPAPRPTAPVVVSPPPVQPRTPSPVRVTPIPAPPTPSPNRPQPVRVTPVPVPNTPSPVRVAPVPAPNTPAPIRVTPLPAPSTPAPARVTPVPAPSAPARAPERREVTPPPKPTGKKDAR